VLLTISVKPSKRCQAVPLNGVAGTLTRKRLTNYTAADVGGIADAFVLAQAAGVNCAI
jgi:hypothetical protein